VFAAAVLCGRGHIVPALAVLSIMVFVVGISSTVLAGLAVSGIAWLCLIGFVVVGTGVLRFHPGDGIRLLLLAGASMSGSLTRSAVSWMEKRGSGPTVAPYPDQLPDVPVPRQR
jgi:hypothetical protein